MTTTEDMRFACLELAHSATNYREPPATADEIIAAAEKFLGFVSSVASGTAFTGIYNYKVGDLVGSSSYGSDIVANDGSYLFGPRTAKEQASRKKDGRIIGGHVHTPKPKRKKRGS